MEFNCVHNDDEGVYGNLLLLSCVCHCVKDNGQTNGPSYVADGDAAQLTHRLEQL